MTEKNFIENLIKNNVENVQLTGRPYVSNFLNPYEQSIWFSYHKIVSVDFDGGYLDAERKVAYIKDKSKASTYLDNNFFKISVIRASISAFNVIGHRQVLGALIHNGIKREFIGDILFQSNYVQIFVKSSIVNFIVDNPLRIGKELLNFNLIDNDQFILSKESPNEQVVISSLRTDLFIATIFKISRSKVRTLFSENRVFINFRLINKMGNILAENDIITVRGFGRIKFVRVIRTSKKDKLVVEYHKK